MTERRNRKNWNFLILPDGARIRWTAGEGRRRLLLIPGFGGDGECWGSLFPRHLAARGIAAVAYDPRGTGGSTAGSAVPSLELFASDAAAAAEAAGGPLGVFGWSMGASVAAELALARPDLVSFLILCCGSADQQRVARKRPEFFRTILDRGETPERIAAVLAEAILPSSGEGNPSFRKAFRETVAGSFAASGEGIRGQQAALENSPSLEGRLGALKLPVLIVEGLEDRLIPPGEGKILAGVIPGALLRTLRGGHGLVYEAAADLAGLVAGFPGG